MPRIIPQVELQTHDDGHTLRFASLEKFSGGSGYRCVLFVRSGGFSCERPFYFDDSHFHDALDALKSMDDGTPGKALIKGQWDDDYIRFESNDMGHVFVSGELHEHSDRPQMLKFTFRTDQTVLGPLIRAFNVLLEE